jgi:hypothetical protein
MLGLEITHPCLDESILIPFRPIGDMTVDNILSVIERVNQSKRTLNFDENITIRAVIVHQPQGCGGRRMKRGRVVNIDEFIAAHSGRGGCFIKVENI